ncbi:hypothetical protein LTR97_007174 [Elasticomyces elasticus]|uniref:Uncharacterized protein n=1 Tax=Elasticomyces elasticus TaxID=574655 RepID=A0AAN7W4B2_9PEZI|nr:hypothetical protein LTR97_007174 [Elasticomyces elasticus]
MNPGNSPSKSSTRPEVKAPVGLDSFVNPDDAQHTTQLQQPGIDETAQVYAPLLPHEKLALQDVERSEPKSGNQDAAKKPAGTKALAGPIEVPTSYWDDLCNRPRSR